MPGLARGCAGHAVQVTSVSWYVCCIVTSCLSLLVVCCLLSIAYRIMFTIVVRWLLQRCVLLVVMVPFRHGAGPRLHFVALRPIERGEVRY